jgi:hypothetical protein
MSRYVYNLCINFYLPVSNGSLSWDRKIKPTLVLLTCSYFTFYKCSALHNFTFLHDLLPHRIPVSEIRLIHTSQFRAFSTLLFLSVIASLRGLLQSNHIVHPEVVKICQMIQKFKCERHMNTAVMLKVYILENFPF